MIERAAVVAQARLWLGTPYVHQHRARGYAADCVGMIIGVARELSLVEPDFDVNGYTRQPDGTSMLALCDRFMTRVLIQDLSPGHVLVFAFHRAPVHMGIVGDYRGGLSIIQALGQSDGKGRVIEQRLNLERRGWKPIQAYSLPWVEP